MMTARRPNLRTNRRGATALLFGLAALPLIAIVALAVDFGAAASAKAKLDLAADASALTTVMSASNVYANNPLAVLTPAISDGRDRFRAQIGSINGVTLQPIDVQVTRDGSKFTSVVSYAAQYATSFAGIIGSATIPISGSAEAIITTGPYVDVEVLLDNSSSMLIGATMDDINRLLAATKPSKGPFPYPSASWGWEPCAFACHWDPGNRDFYSLTRNPANNIRLRLDQLKSAVDTIVRAIAAKNRPLYRFGLYTFYLDVAKNYPASALNADILNLDMGAAALAATDAVGPPAPANLSDEYNRPYETNITESINNFNTRYLARAGDGSHADDNASGTGPRKFVFLLTDGIEDVHCTGGSCSNPGSQRNQTAVNSAACAAMKAKGATVAVLHTQYYNPNNSFSEINDIQASVDQALRECASDPALYFPVNSQEQIDAAIQAMLNVAIAAPARFSR